MLTSLPTPGALERPVAGQGEFPGQLRPLTLPCSVVPAPLRAPALLPVRVWKSQVEVQWQEPSLEERGGYIRNYTVSYAEQGAGARGEARAKLGGGAGRVRPAALTGGTSYLQRWW